MSDRPSPAVDEAHEAVAQADHKTVRDHAGGHADAQEVPRRQVVAPIDIDAA